MKILVIEKNQIEQTELIQFEEEANSIIEKLKKFGTDNPYQDGYREVFLECYDELKKFDIPEDLPPFVSEFSNLKSLIEFVTYYFISDDYYFLDVSEETN